jgi:hypothetical protein
VLLCAEGLTKCLILFVHLVDCCFNKEQDIQVLEKILLIASTQYNGRKQGCRQKRRHSTAWPWSQRQTRARSRCGTFVCAHLEWV